MDSTFEAFFARATGFSPYPYQCRIALDGLPDVVAAPTGCGKTGLVLAWLWRRLTEPALTPRRLVYALPQRSLVEQVAANVEQWLAALGLTGEVALHVVMGGAGTTQFQWRMNPHRPAIVVGTVDSLVSKALNRGYGIGRALYPIDFALVTNGAHWIIDEVQLCPESTTTLRQLAAFTKTLGTAEPFGLTCMSATVPVDLLSTVDNPGPAHVTQIQVDERTGALARRLGAARTIHRLDDTATIPQLHRPGALTLVVVNTVKTARVLYGILRRGPVPCTLLHSRFRGLDRTALMAEVLAPPGDSGRIVVATQVVEAGLDLDAAALVTEAAPWPSIVQRAGRCNRAGRRSDAELWWLPPSRPEPYPENDVAASVAALAGLEGTAVTGEQLLAMDVAVTPAEVSVLRRPDLVALFDTAPDLSGADIDIAPYVRDADDSDAQAVWALWEGPVPPDDAQLPGPEYRCRVPLRELRAFKRPLWRRDQATAQWTRVHGGAPPRPGETLLIAAADGGYDPRLGFDPAITRPVPDAPSVTGSKAGGGPQPGRDARANGAEEGFAEDDAGEPSRPWLTLDEHSEQTREQARALLVAIGPDLPPAAVDAVIRAAYAHDAGKCHPTWQDALQRLATNGERVAGETWAKSNVPGRLKLPDGFRHELASLLLLDGPMAALVSGVAEPDLVRYLVLAHHGKLRVQVRDAAQPPGEGLAGLTHGEAVGVPAVLGQPAGTLVVDLDMFELGSSRSWTRTALALRDRYGPMVLAYLEMLVRMADWRASAGLIEGAPA